jgi:hypothetical protein
MSATETLRGARAVIRVRRVRVRPHRLTREYAAASEVLLVPAQDNTSLATRRHYAASATSSRPHPSGLSASAPQHHMLTWVCPQRARSRWSLHEIVAFPHLDARLARSRPLWRARHACAVPTRASRSRRRHRVLQGRGSSAGVARTAPGCRQSLLSLADLDLTSCSSSR